MKKRKKAMSKINAIDAELARWLVHDGTLSLAPLDGPLEDDWRVELRERRLAAVAGLEKAGGHDPHPSFLEEPTTVQREAWNASHT